ncbi:MAG: amidase family protein, partial [Micropruina sp.]
VGLLTAPVIADDADVHPACLDAAARAALLLEGLGHRVEEAPIPFPAERWQAFLALWSVGALGIDIPEEREHLLRPLTRWLREVGRQVSGVEYATAAASAQLLARDVATAWDGFDVIVTPTLAQPPVRIGELRDDADPEGDFNAQTRFTPWTSVYNLSGRPAISLPLHTALIEGVRLPIGVMLGGRSGAEETLLSIAAAVESVAPWEHPGVQPALP